MEYFIFVIQIIDLDITNQNAHRRTTYYLLPESLYNKGLTCWHPAPQSLAAADKRTKVDYQITDKGGLWQFSNTRFLNFTLAQPSWFAARWYILAKHDGLKKNTPSTSMIQSFHNAMRWTNVQFCSKNAHTKLYKYFTTTTTRFSSLYPHLSSEQWAQVRVVVIRSLVCLWPPVVVVH